MNNNNNVNQTSNDNNGNDNNNYVNCNGPGSHPSKAPFQQPRESSVGRRLVGQLGPGASIMGSFPNSLASKGTSLGLWSTAGRAPLKELGVDIKQV